MSLVCVAVDRAPSRLRRHPKEQVLPPLRASTAIEAAYRRRLVALVDEMQRSVAYWLRARYRNATPRTVALDEAPVRILQREMRALRRQWEMRWDTMAEQLARYFARSVERRTSGTLTRALARGGMSIKFQMTPAMRDATAATVQANVALIKSIPAQYLGEVEGIVMRSVQTGRDSHQLSSDLQTRLGVTKRRAALIARDQNNKATAAFSRIRQTEAGIEQAVWVHSSAGKTFRPSHAKAGRDKVRFNVAEGWYDPDEKQYIQPGQLINCRCHSRPVVPGFS